LAQVVKAQMLDTKAFAGTHKRVRNRFRSKWENTIGSSRHCFNEDLRFGHQITPYVVAGLFSRMIHGADKDTVALVVIP
jgi:hypothetical protein